MPLVEKSAFEVKNCRPVVRFIIRIVCWIPILFVLSILGWAYYAYTIELTIFILKNSLQKIFYLLFFNFFFILLVWSYFKTIFTSSSGAPDQFKFTSNQYNGFISSSCDRQKIILEEFCAELPISMRDYKTMGIRFCDECESAKPDRAHHCSICGYCPLKMDHHCPWVNNCVHWSNYKYFILFLGYSILFCTYVFCTVLPYCISLWSRMYGGDDEAFSVIEKSRLHILFLVFASALFAISVGVIFFYHLYLTCNNRTTMESCYTPVFKWGTQKNGFDMGFARNYKQVFGPFSLLAFLPVPTTPGDGIRFPLRNQRYDELKYKKPKNDEMDIDQQNEDNYQPQKLFTVDEQERTSPASNVRPTKCASTDSDFKAT